MKERLAPLFTRYYQDRVVQSWPEPFPCRCGRMTFISVNRDGKTCCLHCDEQKEAA